MGSARKIEGALWQHITCMLCLLVLVTAAGCSSTDEMAPEDADSNQLSQDEESSTNGTRSDSQAASDMVDEMAGDSGSSNRLSQHFYREGIRYYNEADYLRAEQSFRRSLEQDPSNQAAKEKLHSAMRFQGKRLGEIRSAIQEFGDEIKVGQQQQLVEVRRLIDQGEAALAADEVDRALRALERARERLEWFDFGVPVGDLEDRAQSLFDQARDLKLTSDETRRRNREQSAIAEAERLAAEAEERRERRIAELLKRANASMMRKDFRGAIALYAQVLEREPGNREARRRREEAEELEMVYREVRLKSLDDENTDKTWEGLAETAIPYDKAFRFPERDVWRDVAAREKGLSSASLDEPFEIQQIRNSLETLNISFEFPDGSTLSDAVNFIRDYTGLNITVDSDIDEEEVSVKLKLNDVRLREALNLLLDNVGLAYTFKENTLYITEPSKAFGNKIFEIYNVTDILNKIRNFPGPSIRVKSNDDTDDGGGNPFGGFEEDEGDEDSTLDPEGLVELIKESTGGDEVWDESESEIEPHKGQILMTATRELHLDVKAFLENLRKGADLFVIVEARFIDVTDDFLEDIGIDYRNLGLPPGTGFGTPYGSLNANNSGGTDIGFVNRGNPNNPSLLMGLDRVAGRVQQIIDGFVGGAAGSRLTSSLRGLTLQLTVLDPFQINAIVRATQESREARTVTAPRVTASNGQRVYVSVITQRAYVQDYELVSGGTGLVVQEVADPVVATFQDGVILDVQPVISSDRKYITVDVRPTIASLVNGVISTVTISLGSITQAAQLVDIDLPEISLQQAYTSVTVPDGGTVLLGGFRSMNERNWESFIPIVGEIPIVKNLFRRKAYLNERRSLYILLTAQVIDLRDEERRLYN